MIIVKLTSEAHLTVVTEKHFTPKQMAPISFSYSCFFCANIYLSLLDYQEKVYLQVDEWKDQMKKIMSLQIHFHLFCLLIHFWGMFYLPQYVSLVLLLWRVSSLAYRILHLLLFLHNSTIWQHLLLQHQVLTRMVVDIQ